MYNVACQTKQDLNEKYNIYVNKNKAWALFTNNEFQLHNSLVTQLHSDFCEALEMPKLIIIYAKKWEIEYYNCDPTSCVCPFQRQWELMCNSVWLLTYTCSCDKLVIMQFFVRKYITNKREYVLSLFIIELIKLKWFESLLETNLVYVNTCTTITEIL